MGFKQSVCDKIDFGCRIAHVAVKLVEQDLDRGLGGENGIPEGGEIVVGFQKDDRRHKEMAHEFTRIYTNKKRGNQCSEEKGKTAEDRLYGILGEEWKT